MSNFCPQAVIFDMDGLLVDSEPIWMESEAAMLTARGKVADPEIQRTLVGLRMRDFWAGMCRAYHLTDDLETICADAIEQMVAMIPGNIAPHAGAVELLDYLQARCVPCALASSSPTSIIDATLREQGWEHYFRTRVSGDDVIHGKPAPDIYLEAARRLGVAPSECLSLEDSPNGARAAVAAGTVCYAVPDSAHSTAATFAPITPHVYASLHDVLVSLKLCVFG